MPVDPKVLAEKLKKLGLVETMKDNFLNVNLVWEHPQMDDVTHKNELIYAVANNICDLIDEKDLSDPKVLKSIAISLVAQDTLPKSAFDPKKEINCQFNYRVLFDKEHPDAVKAHKAEFAQLFKGILMKTKDNPLDEKQTEIFADKLADVAIEDYEKKADSEFTMKENDRITATFADVLLLSLINLYGQDPRKEGEPIKSVFYLAGNLFGIPELSGTQPNSNAFINTVNKVDGTNELGKNWTDSLLVSVQFILTSTPAEISTTPKLEPPTDIRS